ncbi:uncharacterized protein LOC129796142 [Lutzomyia longipalpis]|uniref:uncharacterized protein LOC129796142 n=1 Tax=Lutzomyia longipalpis TaxID=7200 RepID=UPI0024838C14|nr:uncharacterized protein LOC129796142 [Lutzomyia longipalpis]
MYYNALHVVQIYQDPVEITFKVVLSGKIAVGNRFRIPHINTILPPHHLHPLFDDKFSRNEINISLYHCPPFVVDKEPTSDDNNGTLNIRRFDGVEFLLMAHITKHWKRRFFVHRDIPGQLDPKNYIYLDLIERQANIGLCGLWLIEELVIYLEVSHPYAQQCISLLVPRLPAIPRGHYIYLAFGERLWLIYIALVILISLLIYFFVSHNTNDSIPFQFNLFTESVVHVLAIATQHGIAPFPRRLSAKVLIMTWIFFSFLMGAIYSTRYTSILTTSLFRKPINSIREVMDRKIKWGDPGDHLKDELLKSGLPDYLELAEYAIDPNAEEAEKLMKSIYYAQAISVLTSDWAAGTEKFENVSSQYRVMKNCIYKFDTVFAFQSNSPYAAYFNKEIPKYVEAGFLQHWLKLYDVHYKKDFIATFFLETKELMRGPHTLSVDNIVMGLYILAIGQAIATGTYQFSSLLESAEKIRHEVQISKQ